MTLQPRGRQSCSVRNGGCRLPAATSPDPRSGDLHIRTPSSDPGNPVHDAAHALLPSPREKRKAISGDAGADEFMEGVKRIYLDTRRGCFAALTAEPVTPSSRSVVLLLVLRI
jgi:hypothetical protein